MSERGTELHAFDESELYAYHDGELSSFRRWRIRRRLARDPDAQRELVWLAESRALLREHAVEESAPDLWDAISAGLPSGAPGQASRDPQAEAGSVSTGGVGAWLGSRSRWLAPALAAAAAVVALTFGLQGGDAPDGRSVRWLDTGGRAAMVLQDDREATIIWVLDAPGQVSGRIDGAFS
jgi:anti-sigma factor RsiW